MSAADADLWKEAVSEELESLKENATWEYAELPAGRKAIDSRWVFKVKRDASIGEPAAWMLTDSGTASARRRAGFARHLSEKTKFQGSFMVLMSTVWTLPRC